jgi:hypothetical protein
VSHLNKNLSEEQRENIWCVYKKPQSGSNWLLGSFKEMILSYRTLSRACKMNTKPDSLKVSAVIFVLVYQCFDCKALIKNDIVRQNISQSGEAERKKNMQKKTDALVPRPECGFCKCHCHNTGLD